jgi:transcriptional regulator with XRE-family HTH domain
MNNFPKNLKMSRKKAKMTQDDLAQKTGLSKNYLCQIENNKKTVNPSVKVSLLLATDAPLELFINDLTLIDEIKNQLTFDQISLVKSVISDVLMEK